MASLIADLILVVHFAFIVFVAGGQACILLGYFRNWRWVRNFTFRICHLLAIAIVIAQAWASRICPLTLWENALREAAGERLYSGTFIAHWVGKLVYHDAPPWIFTAVYSAFGTLVLLSWFWIRPERRAPGG